MAPRDYTDFASTGPGTLAGRYMRLFWQPVYVATDLLAGHAKPLRLMSEDFTLYRGEDGAPHVIAPRCAHRGTQLSTGWVEGDCLRCFYHGWKYDGSGQCVEMPAEDPSFPPKVRIRSYPTQEYLGLIFAYLGDGDPPLLPRHPEFEEDGVLEVSKYIRSCNYFQNLENGPDEVHVHFAHRQQFGAHGLVDLPRISADETEYGIVQYGTRADGDTRVTHVHMPNGLYVVAPPVNPESGWQHTLRWRVPIDDGQHWSFNVTLWRVTGEAAQRFRARRAKQLASERSLAPGDEMASAILAGTLPVDSIQTRPDIVTLQDHITQMGQGVIADRTHEWLGRTDVGIILLRKVWERELRALAEGRPLKQWTRPERLAATSGV
ncbi:MAG TPA: Rieske 2Fe-2S domain-containing protein [Chloroflexota bacterium]|jgi:5,5'-dehydrodivanillate O-demethylase